MKKSYSNGSPKTVEGLTLPAKVTLVTDNGNVETCIDWAVDASSKIAQTFDVTATLPSGVVNTGGISLNTTVSVTVYAE